MNSAIRKDGVAVITGAAVGIGFAIARRLAKEEMQLVLLDRDAVALALQDRITAHLLIPGYAFTPMNFPGSTFDTPKPAAPWSADQVAERLVEGMAAGSFYTFFEDNEVTREMDQRRMQWSADDLIHDRPALSRWHPAWRAKFAEFLNGSPIRDQ